MRNKGQSISINTIIVAAIALAVLVVLFAIFTGRLGSFSVGVSKTASCTNACNALGLRFGTDAELNCRGLGGGTPSGTYVAGKYDDVTNPEEVCCCKK